MKPGLYSIVVLVFVLCSVKATKGQVVHDSVIVPASTKYAQPTILRKLFIGRNYRNEWSAPVKLPVFHLAKLQGGFTIVDSGGGKQTNNLRLRDRRGKEWTLRSVDKDIEKSIVPGLRNTMVETLMQDLQSAIHPYAALTVPVLARALGIIVAEPRIYFVPDDAAFGPYRSRIANTVCLLEQREPTPDRSDTKNTEKVLEKVSEEIDHRLLQKTMLKARLLDMLIGDWDRHEDQWRWGLNDSAGTNYYYPIPRDRDFVYFRSDGLFMQFASRLFMPYMRGFTREPKALKKLNAKIIDLDREWLNELDAEDWIMAVELLRQRITDSVVYIAVKKIPPAAYNFSGPEIAKKIISRRDALMKHALRYYEFLAMHPIVSGTDEDETFHISGDTAGISVSVYHSRAGKKNIVVYQRRFKHDETKKISIRALGGNDQFKTDPNVLSSIKLYLEGGDGNDLYSLAGRIKTKIVDANKPAGKYALVRN